MCNHDPECPAAEDAGREAAQVTASFPAQGWSLLCNGVIVFEDGGEILPDLRSIGAHRGPALHVAAGRVPAQGRPQLVPAS